MNIRIIVTSNLYNLTNFFQKDFENMKKAAIGSELVFFSFIAIEWFCIIEVKFSNDVV